MTGGEIAVVALIAAAVAATASTAVSYATGSGPDNLNDAFGNWLENVFKGFALGSATAGAGAYASEAPSAGADAGMWAGVSEAEAQQMIAQQGITGVSGATGASTTAAGADMAFATELDPLLGAQGMEAAQATQVQDVMAEPVQSQFSQFWDSPTQFLQRKLGGMDYYQVNQANQYSDINEVASGMLGPNYEQQDQLRKQQQDLFASGLANRLGSFGTTPFASRGKQFGINWWNQQQQSQMPKLDFGTSLGQNNSFNQNYNNYWEI